VASQCHQHPHTDSLYKKTLSEVENTFNQNLSAFKKRLIKFKGTSYSFFNTHNEKNVYDSIYVDGSHHPNDVLIDAIKSFEALKAGGLSYLMITFGNITLML